MVNMTLFYPLQWIHVNTLINLLLLKYHTYYIYILYIYISTCVTIYCYIFIYYTCVTRSYYIYILYYIHVLLDLTIYIISYYVLIHVNTLYSLTISILGVSIVMGLPGYLNSSSPPLDGEPDLHRPQSLWGKRPGDVSRLKRMCVPLSMELILLIYIYI